VKCDVRSQEDIELSQKEAQVLKFVEDVLVFEEAGPELGVGAVDRVFVVVLVLLEELVGFMGSLRHYILGTVLWEK
jgi:nitrogenase subunit NifH